ncbi:hypothetical protein FISHEDRAFT_70453 [Fistulina hepatica ATCC 64428]|uniref:Uncharacterized protein n=1 Tax=Fistulina hepatica ATCC 64428 TaxID=1128425 RepID=A0A0D7ALR7_9AGAR|nr:hypothetical protein FISHEDRAFT_70453 [Fistulina hepatica ATCC 64428]
MFISRALQFVLLVASLAIVATAYPAQNGRNSVIKRRQAGGRLVQLEARITQQECEVTCGLVHPHGSAAWNQCVRECMAGNYPTPPPSPHNKSKA